MAGVVTFAPTREDYIAANRLWNHRKGPGRWLLWLGVAAALFGAANAIFRMILNDHLLSAMSDSLPLILFAILCLVLGPIMRMAVPRQVERMLAQNAALAEPIECRWTDAAIAFSGTNGNADLAWTRLHEWLADEATFVFLQTDRLMHIVPIRVLSSDQRENLFATATASGLRHR
jgi:hypothetical protein